MDHTITHFLRLASAMDSPLTVFEPIPVTIEYLASVLCCTPRNVKFILRKLEDKAYISWQAGRGRGHTSQMSFLRSVEEVLEDHLQELVSVGKIKQGIDLIGRPEVGGPLRERLLTLLNKQMGYHSELESVTGLDVLRITRSRSFEQLDPAFVYTAFESYLLGQICSTLVVYDTARGSFLPGLAHMWEVNEEHTSYLFYLRKGVRFHHGRVMTSKDVKETVQRLFDLQSPALPHFRDITRIELEGDHRIRFDLSAPNLFFLHVLSSVYMSVLPCDKDFAVEPLGSGPYRLLNMNKDVLVLAAFDDYYSIRPLLDRVEIWYLPEQGSAMRQYQLPEGDNISTHGGDCEDNRIDYPALGCRYIMVNFNREGYPHNSLFRQAMRILFDPAALIEELGGNRITPADSFLPWISRSRTWNRRPLEHAKTLLQGSGYQGEEITLAYNPKKEEREEAEWLQQRGREAGLRLILLPYQDYSIEEIQLQADFVLAEEVLEDDWQWGMMNYFVNKSNYLHSLLQDRQLHILQQKLENFTQAGEAERKQLLEQTENILRDNCWVLYGCHMNKRAQLNHNLFGLHPAAFGFLDISKIWIKPEFKKDSK